jgi:hypothetical protein
VALIKQPFGAVMLLFLGGLSGFLRFDFLDSCNPVRGI